MPSSNSSPPLLIITGASRGIGAATAHRAAAAGYAVAVNYHRSAESAQQVVDSIRASGGQAVAIQGDISQPDDISRIFELAEQQFGPVRALVNNAAILEQQMRLDEMTLDRMERIFRTNVFGTMLCCQAAIRRMSTRHGGTGGVIINLSSAAARIGSPGEYIDYAASKGAIDTLTIGLAKEVASEGIRVNAVRPGIIDTEIHASGGDPDRVSRRGHTLPLQRAGTADEVAAAIVWLLSDAASYCTGTTLDVTGGR